jgi:hypothetical protein
MTCLMRNRQEWFGAVVEIIPREPVRGPNIPAGAKKKGAPVAGGALVDYFI